MSTSEEKIVLLENKIKEVDSIKETLSTTTIEPEEINGYLESVYSSPLLLKQKAAQILLRPGINMKGILNHTNVLSDSLAGLSEEAIEQAEIQLKYDTYIQKEKELVEKMSHLEELAIPNNFNFEKISSLSTEARQKFTKIRPATLGQASRISGVNPSDIQILMVFMGR